MSHNKCRIWFYCFLITWTYPGFFSFLSWSNYSASFSHKDGQISQVVFFSFFSFFKYVRSYTANITKSKHVANVFIAFTPEMETRAAFSSDLKTVKTSKSFVVNCNWRLETNLCWSEWHKKTTTTHSRLSWEIQNQIKPGVTSLDVIVSLRREKTKQTGVITFLETIFLSMLLNNPCHTDLRSTLSYHTERKDKSVNHTGTNSLNRSFFQKPTPV